jgi:tRNA(Ile)-lysidine synthase
LSFSRNVLLAALDALSNDANAPSRYLVAFSGGLDSTVLLHALVNSMSAHQRPMLAVHIDHGLQADSGRWAQQCRDTAAEYGVEFHSERVAVDIRGGQGVEAAAREARYAALAELLLPGDWLLSAHHREDQAETLLLNLLRGSGPAGLAGIAALRRFARGWLARPLLSVSQQALRDYAARHKLQWIDDPSNQDYAFDRNFLRHEVLPGIESRWPGAAKRLYRSSLVASESAALLRELGAIDARLLGDRPDRLDLAALRSLPLPRQRNVLRYVLRAIGLSMPSAAQLQRLLDEVVGAREDAEPLLRWPGLEIRRYREHLYLLVPEQAVPAMTTLEWSGESRLELGDGSGFLSLRPGAAVGLDPELIQRGLRIRYRQGGERIKLLDQSHTKSLKNLLQEEGIVPWMRNRLPLVYAGDDLVAVADLWLSDAAAQRPGVAISWQNRPPIH